MFTLAEIQAAAQRIAPHVRTTPLVPVRCTVEHPCPDADLALKLECLQVTGSFKARGAVNKLLSLAPPEVERGIVTASGGNHGLAVAYAGWLGKTRATVYLPETVSPEKVRKFARWGAKAVIHGRHWDEANREAMAAAAREGWTYFHPFADPVILAGQGTTALEVLADSPEVDELVVAIGGGGLISGVAVAAKSLRPSIRIVGVEPEGAPTLRASLEAGRVVELPGITTAVPTLAALKTDPINLAIAQRYVAEIVLVSDEEMREASRWLWFEMGVAADLSGAAALAAVRAGRVRPAAGSRIAVYVCGAGPEGIG